MGNSQGQSQENGPIVNLAETDDTLLKSIYKDDQFHNPWEEWEDRTLVDVYHFRADHTIPDVPDLDVLDRELPVLPVDRNALIDPPENEIRAIWIGHATFLVQIGGITFLTDPIFCNRASPVQLAGPARMRQPPIALQDIPHIDFVLVSHNHYDHLDADVVKNLKNATWIVPKKMKSWCSSLTTNPVVELDWWDQFSFSEKVSIIFTPCQHWSRRGIADARATLWGSYVVRTLDKSVYFSGDTGYCPIFKEVGRKLGPVDLALIPIGAYEPNWFLRPQHVNPEEAVRLHQDIQSKKSIGMHWGTFILSCEPVFQPREDLLAAVQKYNLKEDEFITVNIGQITII